ncbi:hypothetical protein [Microbacterium hibisci]|uniref:hypothetical protein n=1 Tax=Microbacterium hibisci TaxID=2036000 RepID=UPI001943AA5A|nr:hypothetical protein [Microbacterium hibisci]
MSPIDPRTGYADIPSLGTAQFATDTAHHLGEGPAGDPARERRLFAFRPGVRGIRSALWAGR